MTFRRPLVGAYPIGQRLELWQWLGRRQKGRLAWRQLGAGYGIGLASCAAVPTLCGRPDWLPAATVGDLSAGGQPAVA